MSSCLQCYVNNSTLHLIFYMTLRSNQSISQSNIIISVIWENYYWKFIIKFTFTLAMIFLRKKRSTNYLQYWKRQSLNESPDHMILSSRRDYFHLLNSWSILINIVNFGKKLRSSDITICYLRNYYLIYLFCGVMDPVKELIQDVSIHKINNNILRNIIL